MLPENTILQGRYQILEPIGRGGMGAVYRALDLRLRSIVALKETLLTGEAVRKAFEREAQLLAGLRHAALPKVSDHFTEDDGQFLVMEFIPGTDLGGMMAQHEGPFSLDDVLAWGDRLLDALEYLHGHQPPIIHRDIKPQNLKLTDRNELILLDFGLAKGAAMQATRATSSSIFGYTPHYAPLEQIQGTGTDPRSDLYSVAATLYHLLTATPPPDALTRAAAKINDEPDPLTPADQINPQVTPQITGVLNRAMSQRPDQRFASASAMRQALRAAAQGVTITDSLGEPTGKLAESPTVVMVPGIGTTLGRPDAAPTAAGMAAKSATGAAATGTTVGPLGAPRSSETAVPVAGPARWMWPVIGLAVVVAVAAISFVALRGGGGAATPTVTPAAAAVATSAADTPTASVAALTNAQLLQTAVVLQTAEADQRASELATARALVNSVDGAQTQTAIARTPTATLLPSPGTAITIVATEPPASTPTPESATAGAATARPAATRAPTRTPQPVTPTSASGADVISAGGGRLFKGQANVGQVDPARGAGGSCIEGRVTRANGELFGSFGVQVDRRGNTTPAEENFSSGTYGVCGLSAGEWGVSIFMAGGVDIPGSEQIAHQVRIQLTGTPGEIVYVNFVATADLAVPTATPAPEAGAYDGVWRGTNAGTTTTGEYPPGRFEIEVRNNAVYRISVDGPSCPFETYPNYPNGVAIRGNAFSVAGSLFNPVTGANDSVNVTISGTFVSPSAASGSVSAQQGGAACANGTWSASK